MSESKRLSGRLKRIHDRLDRTYSLSRGWPDGEWPVGGRFSPPELEVVVGAVLTQNVSWRNVELALQRLIEAGLTTVEALRTAPREALEEAVRPAGFYRQKAGRLRGVAEFIGSYPGDFFQDVGREELLGLKGVGPETADSILLYACGRPEMVVDAYTIRVLGRFGLLDGSGPYGRIKRLLEAALAPEVPLYKKFHALIVEHAKAACRKTPVCGTCPLREEGCEAAPQ